MKTIRDKIKEMIRLIKKWWLLENLRTAIAIHTRRQPREYLFIGMYKYVSREFFIANDPNKKNPELPEFPGLAYRYWWGLTYKSWLGKKMMKKKIEKRVQDYYELFDMCKKEGYIKIEQAKFGLYPTLTPKADEIDGMSGLLEALFSKYHSVWTMIIIPIITFLIGLFGSQTIKSIWDFIKLKLKL